MRPDSTFWNGKRVVLTGHTGFKGSWLALWLQRLGARVTGIALYPDTAPSLFDAAKVTNGMDSHFCDIRDREALAAHIKRAEPEIVLHLAAQPLVRASYQYPVETFATNMMGTVHLLEALRNLNSVRVALMVTTDKVYRNQERPVPYDEDAPLGGHDPYSASKAASELVITSYRDAFLAAQGVAVASARAGNVIGGGDWSADRIIPDAVRAWDSNHVLQVRRPDAVRPWQHVLEPLAGYLRLAHALWDAPALAGSWNFGPDAADAVSVRHVVDIARSAYGRGEVAYGQGDTGPHEAGLLMLDSAKSRAMLGISSRWNLNEMVGRTMRWYGAFAQGTNVRSLCEADIDAFES
ncbi:CDP-glucose 4,6-dehydratase [Paraburkholderia metrosideri]|uniref:CDP-glucose 4,6-dehydratase n=1 Tax=Paraburkholderia metrosideri TaxID=580937 RepID=A0ABN7HVJ0_9BURK|nr:CDP-glucose 4,6-dehydratase [Paraburkholderia metrosideri]CAD6540202.1 CDP-glucose 4,6-dehydratase [Paraburkholderia metrosideri]